MRDNTYALVATMVALGMDVDKHAFYRQSDVPEVTEVYRWQDENGVWQFSNNPNDAPGAEVMALDGKINIIESAQLPPTASPETRKSIPSSIPGVATVAPEQAAELMDTVTNLQDTIDQRKADMDAISGMKR